MYTMGEVLSANITCPLLY